MYFLHKYLEHNHIGTNGAIHLSKILSPML